MKKLNDRPNSKDYFQNRYLNSCDGVFRSAIITKLYFTGIGYLGYNQFPHYTAQSTSLLSDGFITMAVINPPEKKLTKHTSMQWID